MVWVEHVYQPILGKTLEWRYISLCVALFVLMLTIGIMRGGILKFEVFPSIDGDIITSTIEFPSGTPAEITEQAVHQMEDAIQRVADRTETLTGEPLLKTYYSLVGQTLEDMPSQGPHVGSVQIDMLESAARGVHSKALMVEWEKEIGEIPGVQSLTFAGLQAGPPGAPIEIWIQGENMDQILAAGDELMEKLREFDGVYQIRSDFQPGKNEIRFELKPESADIRTDRGRFGASALCWILW